MAAVTALVWLACMVVAVEGIPASGYQVPCKILVGFNGTKGEQGLRGPVGESEFVLAATTRASGIALNNGEAATWNTRRLNTLLSPTKTWFDLDVGFGQFVLAGPAMYFVRASAPASSVLGHQLRLFSVTLDATIGEGTSDYSPNVAVTVTNSLVDAYVNVTQANMTLRIEHWITIAGPMGLAVGSGLREVYTRLHVFRLDDNIVPAVVPSSVRYASFMPYAQFSHTTTQVVAVVDTPTDLMLGTTGDSLFVSHRSDLPIITIQVAGLYFMSASVHTSVTANIATGANMHAWLRLNGADVARSCNSASLTVSGETKVQSTGFVGLLAAGDFLTLQWSSNVLTTRLLSVASDANKPATPSIALTMHRIASNNFASLSDSATQPMASATVSQIVAFDLIEGSVGLTAMSSSVTIATNTTYIITTSLQFRVTSATATEFRAWAVRNGAPVARSGLIWYTALVADYKLATVWWLLALTRGDVIQLAWSASTTAGTIQATTSSSAKPASPGATLIMAAVPFSNVTLHQSSAVTQTAAATTTTLVAFEIADTISPGLVRTSNTRVTVQTAGVYFISFAVQVRSTTACTIDVWLRKNGVNVADSNAESSVTNVAADIKLMSRTNQMTWNDGDYMELVWRTTSANAALIATAAASNPTRPVVPSAHLTMHRVI